MGYLANIDIKLDLGCHKILYLYEACGQTKWMNHKYLKILFNVVLRGKRRGKVELINQFFMSEMDKWFHSKYLSEK